MLLSGLTVAGGRDTSELIMKKGLSKIDGSWKAQRLSSSKRLANSEKMSPWIEKIKIIRGRVSFPNFKMG